MTATASPVPGEVGAPPRPAPARRRPRRRTRRLRHVPVDDRPGRSTPAWPSPRRTLPPSRPGSSTIPSATACWSARPDTPTDRPLPGHDDPERVHDDGHLRVDRHLHDGQPRPAGAGDRHREGDQRQRRRRAPGAGRPDRQRGRLDVSASPTRATTRCRAIVVTDDRGVTVTCPPATLAPGAQTTCTANGVAAAGQYANIGSVTASRPVRHDRQRHRSVALLRHGAGDRHREGHQRRRRRRPAGPVHPGRRRRDVDLRRTQHGQRRRSPASP